VSLKERITDDMKAAMRAGEKDRLGVIRMITAAIKQREVDERISLNDEQVLSVLEKMIKQRKESLVQFQAGNRQDLVDKETAEVALLQGYLPAQLSEAEIEALIAAAIATTGASTVKDMGKVMAVRIPQGFIDEVVARSDIVEIIGTRVALKKSGREYKACCPFHTEKSPSFWVSPDKQFYHCFGCGAHGTVVGFLMQYEKLGFLDAVADLAERAGLEVPREAQAGRSPDSVDLYEVMARVARFFEQNLRDNAKAGSYAEARGIDATTSSKFALGYAADSWNALLNRFGGDEDERRRLLQLGLIIERDARGNASQSGFYDRFRDRLMFPIRDARGRVLGFGGRIIDQGEPKYLNSPETPLFHKGRELYGLYEARQAHTAFKRLMIVEGYMDVVRLHQAGITYAVATLGTATTQEHLNKIFRMTSELVFCFDGDRAGRQAAWRALENALPLARDGRELKFLFLPEGHDPDTLVALEGRDAFEDRLLGALPLSEYLVQQLLSQTDLSHLDGRAKLASLAAPLFARMPEGVYRELLADALAAEIRMPAQRLKEHLFAATEAGRSKRPPPKQTEPSVSGTGRMSAGRRNLLSQAITLVLHHPRAAHATDPAALAGIDRPGVSVLKELLEQAASMVEPTTAMLLERWRDRTEYARLSELALSELMVAESDGAAQELKMAVEKLIEAYGPGRRMDELLRKAEEIGLNYEEKAELSLLLKKRAPPQAPS
jgi:DNA primase